MNTMDELCQKGMTETSCGESNGLGLVNENKGEKLRIGGPLIPKGRGHAMARQVSICLSVRSGIVARADPNNTPRTGKDSV